MGVLLFDDGGRLILKWRISALFLSLMQAEKTRANCHDWLGFFYG
jgi:hypothetical protein